MKSLKEKSVLVTGGTGSIGRALVDDLIYRDEIRSVTVFSRDEHKQWELENRLNSAKLRCILGDIRDQERVVEVMEGHDVVVHAAALKHVEKGELFPSEFLKTNVLGTENLIKAARKHRPETFLFLSTDKAVNPTSNYGSGKLTAEKMISKANESGDTRFLSLRLGNVFGTRGTVVRRFLQDRERGIFHVTNPENTRFHLTIDDAVQHIYYALEKAVGGEIIVPKLKSFLLSDLVKAVDPKCEVIVSGLKRGEKKHEMLLAENELNNTLQNDGYYIVNQCGDEATKYEFCARYNASYVGKSLDYRSDLVQKLSLAELRGVIEDLLTYEQFPGLSKKPKA